MKQKIILPKEEDLHTPEWVRILLSLSKQAKRTNLKRDYAIAKNH